MHRKAFVAAVLAAFAADPALAHHVMGGTMPQTFMQGFLSGLGHPVIGIDHFAAVVAVGALAAIHRAGPALAIGFIVAMMLGVGLHLIGASVPAAEILVALTVIGLGAVLLWKRPMSSASALTLFVLVGLIHGYALGESIYGAERAPLVAYLAGLAVIQSIIALAAMSIVRALISREPLAGRLIGAGVAGIGLAVLVQQFVPGA